MSERAAMPQGYRPRIVDGQIERYLRLFGAVEVSGTKWCGKTWTSCAHAQSVTFVDRGSNLDICSADPEFALVGDAPHVIDEWQRVPAIWDSVRHAADEAGGEKGRWILTGSSSPHADEVSHSGAGRIGRVRMHPMTLTESDDSTASASLAALFSGEFAPGQCPDGIVDLAGLCCRGGWPEEASESPDDAQEVVREYADAIFTQSVPQVGGRGDLARRVCLSLARTLGQTTTLDTHCRDVFALASGASLTDAQTREVSRCLALLHDLYLVDEVGGWVPASRSPARMRRKPKRYFADPSVAVALLGLSAEALLEDWQTFGLVFENLCMRDLDVYARAQDGVGAQPVRYYRDDSGLEADAIVERRDGSWGAFEIKLSQEKVDQAAARLLHIDEKLSRDAMARQRRASFLAVLTGMGGASYRRGDGVYVIPIRALGP